MLRPHSSRLWLYALIVALPALAAAQEGDRQLFELEPGGLPRLSKAEAAWRVTFDERLLLDGASSFNMQTPDGLEFEAHRMSFERRGPQSVTWRGRLTDSSGSRAIFSMEGGALSGLVDSPHGRYEVRPLADGGSALLRVDLSQQPRCGTEPIAAADAPPARSAPGTPGDPPRTAPDSSSRIDVMLLYTRAMRDELGGDAGARSRARLMVDLTNEGFSNSRMSTRINLAHTGVSPYNESGDMTVDLETIVNHNAINSLRNTHAADAVGLIVSSDQDLCGIAYLMPVLGDGFAPYAFSVTASVCFTTFAHELGHNMGMEHDPVNAGPADEAIFPWAYGHFVPNQWTTLMSYPNPCGDCPDITYFSNPNVEFEGHATGIEGQRDNARVGRRTSADMANFRRSGITLEDDFESGNTSAWSLNRGNMPVVQPGLGGSGFAVEVPVSGLSGRRFLMHRVGAPGKAVDVEFLINADGVDIGGGEIDIVSILGAGTPHTKLTLSQSGSQRRISLLVRGNTGDFVNVASTPIRAFTSERIRLEWRAATTSTGNDGFIRLNKNGGNRGALRELSNGDLTAREVRIGAPYGSVGAPGGGTFLIDDYVATSREPE